MSGTFTYDGATPLMRVREDDWRLAQSAHLGDTGMGSLKVDDTAGTVSIIGLKTLVYTESLVGAAPVFSGYIANRTYGRDAERTEAGREITVSTVDLNARFGFLIITGVDGDRPAETVGARIAWLLASGYLDLADTGWVVYPTDDMDAADYRGQTAANVIADCATIVNFNYFARWDSGSASAGLAFFDSNTSTLLTSSSRISNVLADVDSATTFAPSENAQLTVSPEPVRSGMYVPYLRGAVYVTRPATAAAFAERDGVAPSATVDTEATATALGESQLDEAATEDETITCSILVPPANANDIQHGDRVEVKFSHFPGYEDWVWVRVTERIVSQPDSAGPNYQLELTLSSQTPAPAGVAAQAGIFFTNDDNGLIAGTGIVSFRRSGDSHPAVTGSDVDPLTGPLAYVVGAATPPFDIGGGWWNGIECLAPGTVNVHFKTTIAGVFSQSNPSTVRWQVLLNGAMVAETVDVSQTSGCFAGLCSWAPEHEVFVVLDVVAGDVITAKILTVVAPSAMSIPSGTGQNAEQLKVTGTLFP